MRFLSAILIFLFLGCGYRPVSTMTQNLIGDSVFVEVIISRVDPQNTVIMKDSIREAAIKRLNKDLSDKQNADTIITANIGSLSFTGLSSDIYGYTTAYKVNLVVDYKVIFKDKSVRNISTVGDYDFSVSNLIQGTKYTDSVISDTDRYNAIKNAAEQSFDEFISKLAVYGVRDGKYSQ